MKLVPGSVWKHYRNRLPYLIIGIGHSTDDLRKQVVYRQLYPLDSKKTNEHGLKSYGLWVRDLDEFLQTVETDGGNVPRFSFVSHT